MNRRRMPAACLSALRGQQRRCQLRLLLVLWLACTIAAGCRIQRRVTANSPDAGDAGSGVVPARDAAVQAPSPDAAHGAQALPAGDSPLALENREPGSDTFALVQPARDELAGYASTTSLAPGESVRIFVNVDHDQDVRWELYRVGYYQGHGARLLAKGDPVPVAVQPGCPLDGSTGLIECHWASAFAVAIEQSWLSGYYAFKLINEAGFDTYVPFVVRNDDRRAPILVQASVTTWQAYNVWGGTSLYRNNARDPNYTAVRARRVSFDRPYDTRAIAFNKEARFVRWLEQRGYDASYVTNLDLEADRGLLLQRRLFVTVLHDEYWTVGERDALEQARAAGVSLAFLSANTGYWRIRLDPSSSGVPRRIVTCHKSATLDPQAEAADTTTQFRQHPFPRPENELIGEMYGDWSDFDGFPFVVVNHEHWIYAGTSVEEHETLNSIIGVEWDSVTDNGLTPANIEIVGDSPVVTQVGLPYPHVHASVHYPTPGSFVFAAGSVEWISGLGGKYDDPRVHRMTENLFARAGFMLAQPTRGAAPTPIVSDVGRPAQVRVLAGNGLAGIADGAAAQFSSPAGVAVAASGELYVADTGNQLVRKIDNAGNVTTLAGCRPDRESRSTCFSNPVGIAVDAQGVVYVSDAGQHRIYAIAKDGTLSVFAGTGKAGSIDDAEPHNASFATPRGLAFGPRGELYVADFGNAAIRRIDASGVTTFASELTEVMGVAVDAEGAVYFTSSGDIRLGVIRNGQAERLTDEKVRPLEGVTVGAEGVVFSDAGNYRVRSQSFARDPIVTWLGNGEYGASNTQLVLPRGIVAARGGYAVADSGNHRIAWFKAPAP
jgi:streptogramin lyase